MLYQYLFYLSKDNSYILNRFCNMSCKTINLDKKFIFLYNYLQVLYFTSD